MKLLSHISIIASVFILLLTSCDMVHEFPEPGKEIDPTIINTRIRLILNLELPLDTIITKAADPIDVKKETPDKYDRRYFVEIRNGEYDNDTVQTFRVIKPATDTSTVIINTILHCRKYLLVVWTDFVAKGNTSDLYYSTGNGRNLSAVKVLDKTGYIGGTDFKNTQHLLQNIDLTRYAGVWSYDITIDGYLSSPMAKIRLLADDLDKYAEKIKWQYSLDSLAKTMKVEFLYNGYLPTGFNALTGRLNNSETGYVFNHGCWYPEKFRYVDYALVGSDFVFVNGMSSSVNMSAIIRDRDGNVVNEVSNIHVPISRGKETVVIYKFFTKEYVTGIGINPEFDGEYNVYV